MGCIIFVKETYQQSVKWPCPTLHQIHDGLKEEKRHEGVEVEREEHTPQRSVTMSDALPVWLDALAVVSVAPKGAMWIPEENVKGPEGGAIDCPHRGREG